MRSRFSQQYALSREKIGLFTNYAQMNNAESPAVRMQHNFVTQHIACKCILICRDDEFKVIDDAGYGFVKKDQIAWYERRAAELKAQNGGKAGSPVSHFPSFRTEKLKKTHSNTASTDVRRTSTSEMDTNPHARRSKTETNSRAGRERAI